MSQTKQYAGSGTLWGVSIGSGTFTGAPSGRSGSVTRGKSKGIKYIIKVL